jgi:hypothetical protein
MKRISLCGYELFPGRNGGRESDVQKLAEQGSNEPLALNSSSLGAAIRGNCNEYNSEELVSREPPASNPGLLDVEIRETDAVIGVVNPYTKNTPHK